MNWEALIGWKKSVKFITKEKKTLVANINNGAAQFVSNECIDIINQAIIEKLNFNELLMAIEDQDSRVYMKELIHRLNNIRTWNYEGEQITSDMYQISLDITNDCNLRCKHCCISAGEMKNGEDLSEAYMADIVEKVILLSPKVITLSGGEPLIRKDFKKIVSQIRNSYKGVLTLMTNATLVDDDMAEFIHRHFDAVDVSIDGADEGSCTILRGEGTFERCIAGINRLKKFGVEHISASMVVTKENEYAKNDFMELCKKLGLQPMIRSLDNSGRAEEAYENMVCDEEEEAKPLEKIKETFEKSKLYQHQPQVFACQGANTEFQIDYRGNIYPCGALMRDEYCLGSVLNIKNLKEYLESRAFEETEGYKNFFGLHPCNVDKCCDCECNILCFSCINEIRKCKERKTLYKNCEESKYYYSLFWRDYEGV